MRSRAAHIFTHTYTHAPTHTHTPIWEQKGTVLPQHIGTFSFLFLPVLSNVFLATPLFFPLCLCLASSFGVTHLSSTRSFSPPPS
jgi:hypothetical protein